MVNIKNIIKKLLNLAAGVKFPKNSKPSDQNIKSVLVISLYFAGDLLFHSAVIEMLKKIYPHAEIDLWTRTSSAALLKNDPRINQFIIYDNIKTTDYRNSSSLDKTEYSNLINDLKKNNYSLVIDLTGKKSTASAVKQINADFSIGLNYDYRGYCYDKFVYLNTASEKGHLIDKYLNVIQKGLNINTNEWSKLRSEVKTKPYIYSDENTAKEVDKLLLNMGLMGREYIAIHLTSGWAAKELPLNTFSEIIMNLESTGKAYIFVGDANDKKRVKEIDAMLDMKYDLMKKFANTDFKRSSEFIRKASLFIGSDSAPLHIAAAYEIPSIALFGPTNPGFSAPVGHNVKVIYHKLHCSASEDKQYCTRNGGFTCPLYECMISISSAEIINAVDLLWSKGKVKTADE
ncbi:MAG TPA: glycosyltransferase family 9 protein [Saprospiraceae bacterium]|nr:glycosyltransferase family 9 protein [Saprospiraceae bacterium]